MKKRSTLIIALPFLIFFSTGINAQFVNIPDPIFKALLVGDGAINTSGDGEIDSNEASSYLGSIDASGLGISDLTGIQCFTNFNSLDVAGNILTSLDLHACQGLNFLDCSGNNLNNLSLFYMPLLNTVFCQNNQLTCLDLSTDTAIVQLVCCNNFLTSLNLKNGHNTSIAMMNALGGGGMLYCIQVDNIGYALGAPSWFHDTWSNYNIICGTPAIAGFNTNAPQCNGTAVAFTETSSNETFWQWDFGDGSSSLAQNPTHIFSPGNWIVSHIARNCNQADTTGYTIVQGTDIYGNVTYSGGPLTSGIAVLMPFQSSYTAFDTLQTDTLDSFGAYHFTNVCNDDYLIKIFSDTVLFPTIISTYYDNEWVWDSATVLTHGCYVDDIGVDIVMVETTPNPGTGMAAGYVLTGPGFGRADGEPVHGVDVKLGVTASSTLIAATETDTAGHYVFANLGNGNYTIYVDIPGLERDSVYNITIDALNQQFLNLNYGVDSVKIYIVGPIGIEDFSSDISGFNIYPNPSSDNAIIAYSLSSEANVQLDVYNVLGMKVQSLTNTHQQAGEYQVNFSSKRTDLKPGIYMISLTANGKTRSMRIVVME